MHGKQRAMLAGLLSLALLLGGSGQGSGGSASSSGTPTLVTGEASSPDGRFRVEAGETLRIVAADSGETVWEEDSYPWQAVSWSAGDPVLAVAAYGSESEVFLTAVAPETGASWDFVLPDGSPLPRGAALPEDWCRWKDDIHADITVLREEGQLPEVFRCVFADPEGVLEGSSFLLAEEALPGTYDFDRNGEGETVYLQTLEGGDGFLRYQETGGQTIENGTEWIVALREGDRDLWQREGFSTAHMGWGSLFACRADGQDYLLSYTPYMNQGLLSFQYQLFYLTEDGEPVMLDELSLRYDGNDNARPEERLDPTAMAAFLTRVHGYLENATLLLSTEGGAWHNPGSPGAEFWDDYDILWNEGQGDYNDALSLEENLRNSWVLRTG